MLRYYIKYHKASVGLHSTETGSHWHIQNEDTFEGKNRAGQTLNDKSLEKYTHIYKLSIF